MKIQNTKMYNSLSELSQKLIIKRVNRTKIEEEIIIARNVGLEQWKAQTPLQERWKSIVIEIIEHELDNQQECIGCSNNFQYEEMLQDDGENYYCKPCYDELMPTIIEETKQAEKESDELESKLNSMNVTDAEIV